MCAVVKTTIVANAFDLPSEPKANNPSFPWVYHLTCDRFSLANFFAPGLTLTHTILKTGTCSTEMQIENCEYGHLLQLLKISQNYQPHCFGMDHLTHIKFPITKLRLVLSLVSDLVRPGTSLMPVEMFIWLVVSTILNPLQNMNQLR